MGVLDKIKSSIAGMAGKTATTIFKDIADGVAKFVTTPEQKLELQKFLQEQELKTAQEINTTSTSASPHY